ncbi:unnamed protein product [Ilex paraguariensis]|uniref:Uncharacterized protein n=1 Tax=Ilex paraguariensis TaxID=185542 RepID=A0ABC8UF53_9AQUA
MHENLDNFIIMAVAQYGGGAVSNGMATKSRECNTVNEATRAFSPQNSRRIHNFSRLVIGKRLSYADVRWDWRGRYFAKRTHTTTNRSNQASLQAHLALADRIDQFLRDFLHVAVDIVALEVYRRVHCLHDLLDCTGDQRTDSFRRPVSE